MRTVFIPEKKLIEIKKSVIADAVNDNGVSNNGACPENDEYMIGSEGGANDYFHVNESLMTESYNQFNLDEVGSLHYSVDDEYGYDEDTHKEWWNWYDSEEEYLRSCKNFDGEVYDTDGHQIGFFGGDADEIIDMFGEDIGNEIVNGDGGWITDIDDRMANNGVDLNDVDSVNKAAKRISKPNGESAYLLTDGDTIYFHDHAQIQSVDGMTISRFLELGNIRFGGGNVLSIELIKEPTVQQKLRLKRMLSYADEVYLDIAKPNKYDNMYPEVIFGVNYRYVNPDRIINDIFNYFEEGIRPLGEMKVDYKSVIEEAAKKVVPSQLLKWAIKDRPSPSKHLVIICSNGYLEYFEKKSAASNSLFHLRRWLGNNNVYFVDLDKVQLTENIESEVEASEINLSSFKKQDELAPKIWYGRKLNSKVRLKLLDIADDFWDFANINWVKRSGILLTGSICGKNWSKYSDIDLHIIVDFSKVDERTDFVQEYFNLKKNEWNNSHKNLKIYGFPVELYVEDINADTTSSNKYDLEKNDWVKESDDAISIGLNKYSIKSKSANIMTKIDDLQDECDSTDDDAKLRDIGKRAKKLYRKIKRMRKFGLNRSGEGDSLNIVYKVLRRSGHLEKLWDLSSTLYDKVNSLNEVKEPINEYLDRNYNMPLYKYFKWAETASDEEKAKDLCYNSSYVIEDFIKKHQEIDEFEGALEKYDEDDWYDEDVVDWFVSVLSEYGLLGKFIDFFQQDVPYIEWPSWIVMSSPRIVKNEWCIHFGEDSDSIAREGFTHGTYDLEKLGYTRRDASKMNLPGYNFAYPAYYNRIDTDYGSEAVLFQTSGVEIYHDGDCEHQVIFWGPYAKNFIPIKQAYGEWYVYGNKGQTLYKSENIDDIIRWAMNNKEQYRKQIMAGHG